MREAGGQKAAQGYNFLVCKRCTKRRAVISSVCLMLDRARSNGPKLPQGIFGFFKIHGKIF